MVGWPVVSHLFIVCYKIARKVRGPHPMRTLSVKRSDFSFDTFWSIPGSPSSGRSVHRFHYPNAGRQRQQDEDTGRRDQTGARSPPLQPYRLQYPSKNLTALPPLDTTPRPFAVAHLTSFPLLPVPRSERRRRPVRAAAQRRRLALKNRVKSAKFRIYNLRLVTPRSPRHTVGVGRGKHTATRITGD